MATTNTQAVTSTTTFKQGQVFHGTIKQLYPDQMAEIQVGGQKMIAKLEVPLKAGDAHFFQVTTTQPQPELKVVTGPMGSQMTQQQQMNQLLDTMNLPKTTDMQKLMSHFMKEQMPVTKEQLIQAEAWLKNLSPVEKQQALLALSKMIENKMPFTNEVFRALMSGQQMAGMNNILENLSSVLQKDVMVPLQVKQNIMNQIQTIQKPFATESSNVLLGKTIELLQDNKMPVGDRLQALQLLKEVGMVSQKATLQNWQSTAGASSHTAGGVVQQISQAKTQDMPALLIQLKQWVLAEPNLTNQQKNTIVQLANRFGELPQTTEAVKAFSNTLHQTLTKAFNDAMQSQPFQNESSAREQLLSLIRPNSNQSPTELLQRLVQQMSKPQAPVIQNLVTVSEAQVVASLDSKAMMHAMQHVTRGLGISYEAALNQKAADMHAIAHQLKPQLQGLLEQAMQPQTRDAVEHMMLRMQGTQLLSGENGHQHQLIMQLPLDFLGKRLDATLQWNGRMKEDGKIDANYARVLFYLQMASLEETVIDMQVQNRVVTVTLFNDEPLLKTIAEPFQAQLTTGLNEKGYTLSAVHVKTFAEQNQPKKSTVRHAPTASGGVDYRI